MSGLAQHYATLGLPNGAPFDQVKKMRRSLMLKAHTDKGGNLATAQEINAAFTAIDAVVNPPHTEDPHPEDVSPPESPRDPPTAPPRPESHRVPPTAPPRPESHRVPPTAPPRPESHRVPPTAPPRPASHGATRQVPSPEPQRRCHYGVECTYYGCRFMHPMGYRAREFPSECHFGWGCRYRTTTCKFLHVLVTVEQRGRVNITRTDRQFINAAGERVVRTDITNQA
jgi:hypothetical protein